jgi:hypothetical protein
MCSKSRQIDVLVGKNELNIQELTMVFIHRDYHKLSRHNLPLEYPDCLD